MGISIKAYPARNGDSFLVSFGSSGAKKKHIIVDCGFTSTYNEFLKSDLLEISHSGERIEKLIITHIDSDHIQGAIGLLQDNNSEKFIEISDIWHNSFRHLFDMGKQALGREQEQVLQQIIKRGNSKTRSATTPHAISAEQGTTVGALIMKGGYSWNKDFNGKAVCIEGGRMIKLDEEASLFLLCPDNQKLSGLRKLWETELIKYGVNFDTNASELYDDAFEMLLSWEKEAFALGPKQTSNKEESFSDLLNTPVVEDQTKTNGSSIAFIFHFMNKRLLFLGDAHPDLVTKSLYEYQKEGQIRFDLVKVSHHGSFSNISKELLDRIESDSFLFSTNGEKHQHPHKETIARILSKKSILHTKLYFNYVTDSSEYFNKADWKKEYNYSIQYLNNAPYTIEL